VIGSYTTRLAEIKYHTLFWITSLINRTMENYDNSETTLVTIHAIVM